eukprot:scaffold153640_cov52-Attheya_sp.AAC.2
MGIMPNKKKKTSATQHADDISIESSRSHGMTTDELLDRLAFDDSSIPVSLTISAQPTAPMPPVNPPTPTGPRWKLHNNPNNTPKKRTTVDPPKEKKQWFRRNKEQKETHATDELYEPPAFHEETNLDSYQNDTRRRNWLDDDEEEEAPTGIRDNRSGVPTFAPPNTEPKRPFSFFGRGKSKARTNPVESNPDRVPSVVTREEYGSVSSSSSSSPWKLLQQTMDPGKNETNGDASLSPNRGISNSSLGAGTALPELIWRIRVLNLASCTLALLLEIPSFILGNLLNPAKMVLGGYLIFFSGLLCCFELHTPVLSQMIKDNFGVLYNPIGRAIFLFLMGGLSIGQGGLLHWLVGLLLLGNGGYTGYVTMRYPEYRKLHEQDESSSSQPPARASSVIPTQLAGSLRNISWATPSSLVTEEIGDGSSTMSTLQSETQRLLVSAATTAAKVGRL